MRADKTFCKGCLTRSSENEDHTCWRDCSWCGELMYVVDDEHLVCSCKNELHWDGERWVTSEPPDADVEQDHLYVEPARRES